jgi:hypothetical protein
VTGGVDRDGPASGSHLGGGAVLGGFWAIPEGFGAVLELKAG